MVVASRQNSKLVRISCGCSRQLEDLQYYRVDFAIKRALILIHAIRLLSRQTDLYFLDSELSVTFAGHFRRIGRKVQKDPDEPRALTHVRDTSSRARF